MPRGRPPSVESKTVVQAILNHKNDILPDKEGNAIVVESNPVWSTIAQELLNQIKPSSLYSYVVNNTFHLRDLLFGLDENSCNVMQKSTSSIKMDHSVPRTKTDLGFILTFSKNEFDDLIMETQRQARDKNGKSKFRIVNILKPQKWTELISKKIYDEYRLSHGYHFENSHISRDKTSGGFTGMI